MNVYALFELLLHQGSVPVVGGRFGRTPAIGANPLGDCTSNPSRGFKGQRTGRGREGREDPYFYPLSLFRQLAHTAPRLYSL
jgi:hypothetical protein